MKKNDLCVLFRLQSSPLNTLLQMWPEKMVQISFSFRLSVEVSGMWLKYQNLLIHGLCPRTKAPGWLTRLAGGSTCRALTILSCSAFKRAHSFCMTAQILVWILFQCYPYITVPFKIRYLHLFELGTFYNFLSELYSQLNHYSLGISNTLL